MQIEDGIILHIIIYITQNPDPLISDCYYSMKGANVIDFFVYQIGEACDQAPPRRKEAEKQGQIGKHCRALPPAQATSHANYFLLPPPMPSLFPGGNESYS